MKTKHLQERSSFKKLLKEAKFLTDENEIRAWCENNLVAMGDKLEIHEDGSISIENFICAGNKLTEIPVKIRKAKDIDVSNNQLTSFDWAPQEVEGSFDCWANKFTSLHGCPQKIGGSFDCDSCLLTSLEGGPVEVGTSYICSGNQLTTLKGVARHVGMYFKAQNCGLQVVDYLPEYVGTNVYLVANKITSLKGIQKLLKSLGHNEKAVIQKRGKIVIAENPIQGGLLSCFGIDGFREIAGYHNEHEKSDLANACKIINKGIEEEKDAFDIAEDLTAAGYGQMA